jgi:antitoxin component of MazEF toxin-antitoxin module
MNQRCEVKVVSLSSSSDQEIGSITEPLLALPPETLKELGLSEEERVEIELIKGRIVIGIPKDRRVKEPVPLCPECVSIAEQEDCLFCNI